MLFSPRVLNLRLLSSPRVLNPRPPKQSQRKQEEAAGRGIAATSLVGPTTTTVKETAEEGKSGPRIPEMSQRDAKDGGGVQDNDDGDDRGSSFSAAALSSAVSYTHLTLPTKA